MYVCCPPIVVGDDEYGSLIVRDGPVCHVLPSQGRCVVGLVM